MIAITHPDECCGCGSCTQICPRGCLALRDDAEGFPYPQAEASACISCGLCEQVCPWLHPGATRSPLRVVGARHPDEAVRENSSSGGVFAALAQRVLDERGVVFGAAFDGHFRLTQQRTDRADGLHALMGSKYIQSRNADSFAEVRRLLREGRRVLYCGTPCLVAGLHRHLGRSSDLLLTADFFCHGVPSPLLWERFFDQLLARHQARREDVAGVSFRDKERGWRRYSFRVRLRDGRDILLAPGMNAYQRAFAENLSLRPSCHRCRVRAGRSHSDLTLADFWDIAAVHPCVDDDRGVSLVLANTPKGETALQQTGLATFGVRLADALRHNPAYAAATSVSHPLRSAFFDRLPQSDDVEALIGQMLHKPLWQRLREQLHLWIYLTKQHLRRHLRALQPSSHPAP